MRVLVVAYTCHPGTGSEPGIGWGFVSSLATQTEVSHTTVLVSDVHEPTLGRVAIPGLHFEFVRGPAAARLQHHPLGQYLYYLLWQVSAYRSARRHGEDFDVVHHVTYGSSWLPALVPMLCRAPVRLINVGNFIASNPWWLWRRSSPGGLLRELFRTVAIGRVVSASRHLRRLLRRGVVTHGSSGSGGSPDEEMFPPGSRRRWVLEQPLGGLPGEELTATPTSVPSRQVGAPLRLLCLGRLLAWKGFEYVIRALPKMSQDARLVIAGAGPEEARLRKVIAQLDLTDRVELIGWVSREDLPSLLARSDVLVHPSLREHFGYVVLEAMAHGVPPVVCAGGGPASIVGDVPELIVQPHRHLERDIAAALDRLSTDADLRLDLSESVRQRARAFSWDEITQRFVELYSDLLMAKGPQ